MRQIQKVTKLFPYLFLVVFNFLISTVLWGQDGISGMSNIPTNAFPINVSVSGKVKNPGSYYLTNMNRVTDAIYKANLITMTETEPLNIPDNSKGQDQYVQKEKTILAFDQDSSLRNVILHRRGKDIKLDVLQFIRKGDISQNPYLEDGDVIMLFPAKMLVNIDGAVSQPGRYEIKEKETLGDIVVLAGGLKPEADLKRGTLYRYLADGKSITTIDLAESDLVNLKIGSGIKLEHGDRIMFGAQAEYHADRNVRITGEIKYPGNYAIGDSISLLELLHKCGGPTPKADLRNAKAFNNMRVQAYDPAFSFLRLQNFAVTNKTDEDYLRMKIRQPLGLIATNIERLWITQDKSLDIYLHKDDIVEVPEINNTITLLGQVETPGVYDWHPNKEWTDYIEEAGGYNWHADLGKIRIIRAFSGNWIKPTKDTKMYAGDMLFIPSKPDRTNWDIFKETLLLTSQIVTILFAVKSLTQ